MPWSIVVSAMVLAGPLACSRNDHAKRGARGGGRSATAQPVAAQPVKSTRLAPADLAYRGAFRLPEAFDWGARGLTFDGTTKGGALLVIGNDLKPGEFARISIPKPVVSRSRQKLPLAKMLTPMRSFDGSIVEGVNPDYSFASGIELVPPQGGQKSAKLYGSLDNWYGVVDESHPTIWFAELDGSKPRGPFHVGPRRAPYHGNRVGDFLFSVPKWYADAYLGGRILVTGKNRGAFFGSMGPTLFAFRPWDSESPKGDLDAVAMLYYRLRYPDCAGPNVGDKKKCDYPEYTFCDKWEGGSFVEKGTKRAIVLLGAKGLGTNYYGEAPNPQACESSKGYHCDPYERQVIFYDVDELGLVAQGKKKPWTVVPYAVWKPKEFLLQGHTCGQVGGVTTDAETGRVFMIEKGLGENNSAVVHIWASK